MNPATKFARGLQSTPGRVKAFRLAFACLLALSFGFPAVAQAQDPLPPGCQAGALPSNDPLYPSPQSILICIPPNWNGQLVVYAHGYFPPQSPLILPDLTFPDGTSIPGVVMSLGYAFATSSYHKNGYAVEQAGNDLNALVAYFKSQVPGLRKVLGVGVSEGGLITTMLIEKYPDTYSGGVALCGELGGRQLQAKYFSDFRVVFDYFFPGIFNFGVVNVPPDAFLNWETQYVPAITQAVTSHPAATAQLLKVTHAAVDPQDPTSALQTILGVLAGNIFGEPDLILTAGGNPYDNRFTLYFGSANDKALNAGVERVRSDAAARAYLRRFYQTTGELERPLVTLHTTLDPIVPFYHELVYAGLALKERSLRNLTILPIQRYGHCTFTTQEVLGAFAVLVSKAGGQAGPELERDLASLPAPMSASALRSDEAP
jgi:pimeloyl-ACP methyl ester carboxylesterase